MPTTAPSTRYPRPTFADPLPGTFLYLGMSVDPPRRGPRVGASRERARAIARCHELIVSADGLEGATVFESVLIPPLAGVPPFDVVVLARADGNEALDAVRATATSAGLPVVRAMTARNVRRFGETERTRDATFLLNHFTASEPGGALAGWDDVVGYYAAALGVDNSTLLRPEGDAPFDVINYVRVPGAVVPFVVRQLASPGFHRFVRPTLARYGATALPLFVRPA